MRSGESVSKEIPLGLNGVMALALAKGFESTKNKDNFADSKGVALALSGFDPFQFEDDPNDGGSLFLLDFVELLGALEKLKGA